MSKALCIQMYDSNISSSSVYGNKVKNGSISFSVYVTLEINVLNEYIYIYLAPHTL